MTCPACRGGQFQRRTILPEIAVQVCAGCGLLISEIAPVEKALPEFARINEQAYQQSVGLVRRRQASEILALVRECSPPGNSWLDVGCSFGYMLREAQQGGFQVSGVEPDERAAEAARKLLGADVVRLGLMCDEGVPDASVAVISTLDVLEHIPADGMAFFAGMIRRKLVPGGLWVIKVPSTEGLYFTLAHLFPSLTPRGVLRRLWQADYEYPHTVYFNRGSLRRFLESHGFEVTATRYLADVPNSTVIDRLRMDDTIPAWQAPLLAPAFYGINFVEALRGKSDALVMVARR